MQVSHIQKYQYTNNKEILTMEIKKTKTFTKAFIAGFISIFAFALKGASHVFYFLNDGVREQNIRI